MLSSIRCTRKSPIFVTALVVITSSYFFIFGFFAGVSSGFFSSFFGGSDLAGSAGLSSAQIAELEIIREAIQIRRIPTGRSRKNMRHRLGQKVGRFKRKGRNLERVKGIEPRVAVLPVFAITGAKAHI